MPIKKIIFAGTPFIAAKLLQDLLAANLPITSCYTQPDTPQGRGQKLGMSPVKQLCLTKNIPILQPNSLKNPEQWSILRELQPDLIIVFAYGLILPAPILQIPKFGCINIHTSLLPRWRGAAPTQHAILAGDKITGITIMQMDEGLDTGDILYQITCNISNQDTNKSLLEQLQPLATQAILAVLNQITNNKISRTQQDNSLACYANKINKADAKINWRLSAMEIDRQIRAFIPEPVAYTSLATKDQVINNIKIWKTQYNNATQHHSETPGTVVSSNSRQLEVATTKGVLYIEQIQFPGGKIQPINSLLNASKYKNLLLNAVFK